MSTQHFALFSFTLAACFSSAEDPRRTMTKLEAAEAEGRSDDGKDLCAEYEWYGDGVCDTFCPDIDEDCAVCLAIAPACGDEESTYGSLEACEAAGHQYCRGTAYPCGPEEVWCGGDDPVTCLAYPACDEGEFAVDECPADRECREVSICGSTIWCLPENNCEAYPTCAEGEETFNSIAACESAGYTDCHANAICSYVVYCGGERIAHCEAYPTCGDEEETFESFEACEEAGFSCRSNSICGYVVYCGSEYWCEATPSCEEGEMVFSTIDECRDAGLPPTLTCVEVALCGTRIVCARLAS